jgi:hypothetical protein
MPALLSKKVFAPPWWCKLKRMQFETADFHPRIVESIDQLDAMITNGDYWLDQAKQEAVSELLAIWSRVHAEHIVLAQEMQEAGEL